MLKNHPLNPTVGSEECLSADRAMPDVDKLFEKAKKYLQKQKFDSALETYVEINTLQPNSEDVLLNLAELSLKLNRTSEGLRYESQLADYYIKRNDGAKAIATCRKILKISRQDAATYEKLAALLEKGQKKSEALEAYRETLELYRKTGASAQLIACLEHIVKLAPDDLDANVELAEAASSANDVKLATRAFLQASQLARQAGQEDRWAEFAERAHTLDPADPAASVAAAKVYLGRGKPAEAIDLLRPLAVSQPDNLTILKLLARGYLAVRDYGQAQPIVCKLYQAQPAALDLLMQLVEGRARKGEAEAALSLLGQLQSSFVRLGKKNEFLKMAEKVFDADQSNLPALEMLTTLYNEFNKEEGLRRSLTRLFNLYLASDQYNKAAETLEQIIDVDPYGEGHSDRLLNLEGHIENFWYQNIAARVEPPAVGRATGGGAGAGPTAHKGEGLDNLVIEGEMYYQYLLTGKLRATLDRINQLYPGAEEKNQRLRDLYDAAGFTPKPAHGAPGESGTAAPAPAAPPARPTVHPQSLEELQKISTITANIYRESTPQGAMQVAVNEIGRSLGASRAWGGLGSPDRPPTLTGEYCSPAASGSEIQATLKLYATLMQQTAGKPDGWLMENPAEFPALAPIQAEIQKLGIQSLLAVPLIDRDQPAGLLLIEQCNQRRSWTPGEIVMVKAIGTQVVIAVNNAKLRRLARSVAGADGETGLLPRSSYLDCLLTEAAHAKERSEPLSICLAEPANPATLIKALGDPGVQRYIEQVAKGLQSNLRQNDIPIRYGPCAIAILFGNTPLDQGALAVEKLRRTVSQVNPDGQPAPVFCLAVCDVPLGANFDAVDGVTEVVNRLEATLEQSRKEGGKSVLVSAFRP